MGGVDPQEFDVAGASQHAGEAGRRGRAQDASTVTRTENGMRNISSEGVAALLVLYGVTGQERERLPLAEWRKSSRSGEETNCVEVAVVSR